MLNPVTTEHESIPEPLPTPGFQKFRIVLIKPSKYDDDGYVIRFWKGVLPSNTLNVLHGLTEAVKDSGVLGDLPIEIVTFDETAEKLPVRKIIRWSRRSSTKLVVGLVGVQTNQFPRAFDLAHQFRAAGIDVIIGGFHTSGTINMLSDQEPDIQALVKESITIVSGEVEENWGEILADSLHGRLKPIYSFASGSAKPRRHRQLSAPPDQSQNHAPLCRTLVWHRGHLPGLSLRLFLCTIINVQGRKMRERSPESIAELLRMNYRQHGVSFYFFTDDNFARKKLWRETFEEIIKLRKKGIKISFMMQVDLARKPKDFVKLAAQAGCTQVFIGMEDVNPQNLKAEGKGRKTTSKSTKTLLRNGTMPGLWSIRDILSGFPLTPKRRSPRTSAT